MLNESKPHKGTIKLWWREDCGDEGDGLGYMIRGTFVDHPEFAGWLGHTSYIVAVEGDEVETRNSRYTLIEKRRPHVDAAGEFQSDKYPSTPAGKVPLSTKDPLAQDLLWEYARRRRAVDAEFSDDLEFALRAKGFEPDVDSLR